MACRNNSDRRLRFEKLEYRFLMTFSLNAGLVGQWPMNESSGSTVADLVGGDQPGQMLQGATFTTGKIRGGVQLDGVDDTIQIANSSVFNILTAPFSVAIWVRTQDPQATVMSRGPANNDHWALRLINGVPQFQFMPGGSIQSVTSTQSIADGNWHHLIGVRNGTHSATLYVDGVRVASLANSGPYTSVDTTQSIVIGGGDFGMLQGSVDDARFYRRALSDQDAVTLFQLGQAPVAVADTYGAIGDTTLVVDSAHGLLSNDLQVDEVALSLTVLDLPQHGTLQLLPSGAFQYQPNLGFSGLDSFHYSIQDGRGATTNAIAEFKVDSQSEWAAINQRFLATAKENATDYSDASIATWMSLMAFDGSFSDLIYTAASNDLAFSLMAHTWRLRNLVRAYAEPSSTYSTSPIIRQALIDSWSFLANTAPGTRDLPNWYSQKIGIPNSLWPGLAMFQSELSPSVVESVLDKFFTNAGVWDPNDLTEQSGGMNLSYRALATIAESIIRRDPSRIPSVVREVQEDISNKGRQATGLRPDDSFQQHTSYPVGSIYQGGIQSDRAVQWYSGTYGIGYAYYISQFAKWLHQTPLSMASSEETSIVDFVLDGQRWLFRGQSIEPTSTGRSITLNAVTNEREEVIDPAAYTRAAATNLLAINYRSAELQSFADSLSPGSTSTSGVVGNRSFWTSDAMVQQNPNYIASVRMISQRTLRPETLQRPDRPRPEGAKSYFLGDGVTTVYQDQKEYGPNTGREIFPVWNWTRLPGTTLEQISDAQLVALSNSTARDFKASSATGIFVGSVTNGKTGLAAMDYGRTAGNVKAEKSWFFFEGGFMALGAGIQGPQAINEVDTTLVQVVANGDATLKDNQGNLQTIGPDTTQSYTDPKWLLHNNVGYVPIGSQDPISIQRQVRSGDWSDIGISQGAVTADVFTAWFDHGSQPTNKSYAYVVLPNSTAAQLDSYVSSPTLKVLSNSTQVQAVQNTRTATTQIAFYQPGSLTIRPGLTITVSQPCLLQVSELPNQDLEFSISDPTQSQSQINLSVTRRLYNPDITWDADAQVSRWTVMLPSGESAAMRGQSTTREVWGTPRVKLSISNTQLPEKGGSGWIYAQLSAPAAQNVRMEFSYQGTATLGVDYLKSSVVALTIPAGQTLGSTWISVRDDAIYEGNESIQIEISKISNALETEHQVLVATIIDDDPAPAIVSVAWSTGSVPEANGAAYLVASLAQPSSKHVTIDFAFAGNATPGTDFVRSAATKIVIPAGQLSGSLWIVSRDDLVLEGPETISAIILGITNGITLGSAQYDLLIVDDEVSVQLAFSNTEVKENRGVTYVIATLSAPSAKPVRIDLSWQGTATSGMDYTRSAYTYLLIPAGQLTNSLWVIANQDSLVEGDETIQASATTITGATLIGNSSVVAKIIDDDFALNSKLAVDVSNDPLTGKKRR